MPDNERAMRCDTCLTNWPMGFGVSCFECGGTMAAMNQVTPISYDEAKSRKAHALFEKYCDERDQRIEADIAKFASQIADL